MTAPDAITLKLRCAVEALRLHGYRALPCFVCKREADVRVDDLATLLTDAAALIEAGLRGIQQEIGCPNCGVPYRIAQDLREWKDRPDLADRNADLSAALARQTQTEEMTAPYARICKEEDVTENFAYEAPWTWRDRLRFRLFPTRVCPLPMPERFTASDCVISRTAVGLDWIDRVRVLVSGRLMVETRTATEHEVGQTESLSTGYPVWRFR